MASFQRLPLLAKRGAAEGFVEWCEVLFDFCSVGHPGVANVAAGFFGEVGEGGSNS